MIAHDHDDLKLKHSRRVTVLPFHLQAKGASRLWCKGGKGVMVRNFRALDIAVTHENPKRSFWRNTDAVSEASLFNCFLHNPASLYLFDDLVKFGLSGSGPDFRQC